MNFQFDQKKFKSILATLLLCFLLNASVKSQNSTLLKRESNIDFEDYPNAVYIELLGNGLPYSINYERRFYGYRYVKMYGRGGLGLVAYSNLWGGTIPIEYSVGFGNKNNFETGVGCTLNFTSFGGIESLTIPFRIGYRLEIDEFLFRFGFTPFFDNGSFFPMLGLSFGKRIDD